MVRSSDEVLKNRVQAFLDSDAGTKVYGIKADVTGGKVYLAGIVDTLSEKERLGRLVSGLEGVRGVENGVSISTDGAIDDEDVTMEVMEELESDPQVDLRHVGARSVKGTVFLTGRINSREEETAAVNAASRARGVRNVVSRLDMETAGELTLEKIFHSQVNNDREVDRDRKKRGLLE
ncbi:MAG: BON domain-containing protein [Firmicutes bacterium]|nr:BON domain-containing protein [Bacillota bacterium]